MRNCSLSPPTKTASACLPATRSSSVNGFPVFFMSNPPRSLKPHVTLPPPPKCVVSNLLIPLECPLSSAKHSVPDRPSPPTFFLFVSQLQSEALPRLYFCTPHPNFTVVFSHPYWRGDWCDDALYGGYFLTPPPPISLAFSSPVCEGVLPGRRALRNAVAQAARCQPGHLQAAAPQHRSNGAGLQRRGLWRQARQRDRSSQGQRNAGFPESPGKDWVGRQGVDVFLDWCCLLIFVLCFQEA